MNECKLFSGGGSALLMRSDREIERERGSASWDRHSSGTMYRSSTYSWVLKRVGFVFTWLTVSGHKVTLQIM